MYHKESLKDKETQLLIGVCEVDTTILGTVEGMELIDGYYRLHKDGEVQPDDNLGIIKVRVVPSKNVKKSAMGDELYATERPASPNFAATEVDAEAKTLNDVYETLRQIRGNPEEEHNILDDEVRKEEEPAREQSPNREESKYEAEYEKKLQTLVAEISEEESSTLLQRHLQNLQELDVINRRLRGEPETEAAPAKEDEGVKKEETVPTPAPLPAEPIKTDVPEEKKAGEEMEELKESLNQTEGKDNEYELEIGGADIDARPDIAPAADEPREAPKELAQTKHATNVFEKNLFNVAPSSPAPAAKNPEEEHVPKPETEKPAQTIDRKKLLSTPHKKPPLPQHLSSSIKRMSGNDLKEKELERITRIMRASPAGAAKKYYDYSSDSDA